MVYSTLIQSMLVFYRNPICFFCLFMLNIVIHLQTSNFFLIFIPTLKGKTMDFPPFELDYILITRRNDTKYIKLNTQERCKILGSYGYKWSSVPVSVSSWACIVSSIWSLSSCSLRSFSTIFSGSQYSSSLLRASWAAARRSVCVMCRYEGR